MKKPTRTPKKPAPRTPVLDHTILANVIGGCTNENLTEVVIR
jgi:hypothetical protein